MGGGGAWGIQEGGEGAVQGRYIRGRGNMGDLGVSEVGMKWDLPWRNAVPVPVRLHGPFKC